MEPQRTIVARWLRKFDLHDDPPRGGNDWDELPSEHQEAYLKFADELLALLTETG